MSGLANRIKINLEGQLEFIENNFSSEPWKSNPIFFRDQIEQAEFYVTDLMAIGEEVKDYNLKIEQLKENYKK
jgi:hypothetical protein